MRGFRFGIKHLLILLVCVCAVTLAYGAVCLARYVRYKPIVDRLEHVTHDVIWKHGEPVEFHSNAAFDNLLFTHRDFEAIAELDSLHTVSIMFAPTLSEEDFAELKTLRNLQVLRLVCTPFTDAALLKLYTLSDLRCLVIDGTAVSNQGIQTIKGFRRLYTLSLSGTNISNKGLTELIDMPSLKRVWLSPPYKGGLTVDGVRRFHAARPDIEVIGGPIPNEAYYKAHEPNWDDNVDFSLLCVNDSCCPSYFICKVPKDHIPDLMTPAESLQITVEMILKGVNPPLPKHVMKYFSEHAELSPELVNKTSPQLRDLLAKGVPIEITFGFEGGVDHGGTDATLTIPK